MVDIAQARQRAARSIGSSFGGGITGGTLGGEDIPTLQEFDESISDSFSGARRLATARLSERFGAQQQAPVQRRQSIATREPQFTPLPEEELRSITRKENIKEQKPGIVDRARSFLFDRFTRGEDEGIIQATARELKETRQEAQIAKLKIGEATARFAGEVIGDIAEIPVQFALDGFSGIQQIRGKDPVEELKISNKGLQFFFGESIKSFDKEIRDGGETIEQLSGLDPATSKLLSGFAVAGLTAMDIAPGGDDLGKKAIKKKVVSEIEERTAKKLTRREIGKLDAKLDQLTAIPNTQQRREAIERVTKTFEATPASQVNRRTEQLLVKQFADNIVEKTGKAPNNKVLENISRTIRQAEDIVNPRQKQRIVSNLIEKHADILTDEFVEFGAKVKNLTQGEARAISELPELRTQEGLSQVRANLRSSVSDVEAEQIAADLNWDNRKVLSLPVDQPLSKEQTKALQGVVLKQKRRVDDAFEVLQDSKALNDGIPEAGDSIRYTKEKAELVKLLAQERAIAGEAGRSLQAHAKFVQEIDNGERALAELMAGRGKVGKKLTEDERLFIIDQVEKAGDNPEAMLDILKKAQKASFREMAVEFSTAIKLFGPATHAVNMLTAGTRLLTQIPLRVIEGAIDSGLDKVAKLPGGKAVLKKFSDTDRAAFVNDAMNEIQGQWSGLKSVGPELKQALLDEDFLIKQQADKAAEFLGKAPAIKGRLGKDGITDRFLDSFGKKVRTSFRLLGVEDLMMRRPAEMGALYTMAGRDATQKGLKYGSKEYNQHVADIITDPPAKFFDDIEKAGKEVVFQEELGPVFKAINDVRQKSSAIRLIVPFFKTIANVTSQAVQFSPFAFASGRARKKILDGSRKETVEALAKMTLGTGMMVPLVQKQLEDDEFIVLGAPRDKAEKENFYAEGKVPYSVKVGDNYIPFGRLSPVAELFTFSKLSADALKNKDEDEQKNLVANFLFGFATNLSQKSFLTGVNDIIKGLIDEDEFSATRALNNIIVGSTLPSISGSAARSVDPVIREQKSLQDKFFANVPFLSKKLPARIDVFGEEIKRDGNALMRFVSPVIPSKIQTDVVREELKAIDKSLTLPKGQISGFDMDAETARVFQRMQGEIIYSALHKAVVNPQFQLLTDSEKQKVVDSVVNQTRDSIKQKLAPELLVLVELKKQLKKSGMTNDQAHDQAIQIFEQAKSQGLIQDDLSL